MRMKRTGDAAPQGRFLGWKFDRRVLHVLVSLLASHAVPFRVAKQIFFGSGFSAGAWICWPVASAGIEHEGVAVFESDFDRPAGRGALIEPIGLFRFVIVGNPLPDGLPGRNDGIEGLDVEGRVGRWREVDDAFPQSVEAEEEFSPSCRNSISARTCLRNSIAGGWRRHASPGDPRPGPWNCRDQCVPQLELRNEGGEQIQNLPSS